MEANEESLDGNVNKEGIYQKYTVVKNDGSTDEGADYFVLRLDKDPHARIAALKYAESIVRENFKLSLDLTSKVLGYEPEIRNNVFLSNRNTDSENAI